LATFPTFESVLLHIAKALGANSKMSSKSKSKFSNVDMSMGNLTETWTILLGDIADVLKLDKDAKSDLISNIFVDYNMHKSIEIGVFTSQASQRKVVWQYLARIIVPLLARHSVFWQMDSKMDEGMPGGRFWYLPSFDSPHEPTQLHLPIPQVLNWLIDLIQDSNANIAKGIERDLRIYEGSNVVLRNLYNWKRAKSTPEISSINNTFPDEVKIHFQGCFEPTDEFSKFEQALTFVKKKGLLPSVLQHEIAINEDDLKRIFIGDCSIDEQYDFVDKIILRYQVPSARTIRLRLLTARAVQEGYEQLVKFLTPSVDKLCIDLDKNKTLQLIQLYMDVYNRTLEAHLEKRHIGESAENKYFTERLPPFLRYDLLCLVSYDHDQHASVVSNRLNSIFSRSGEENNLDKLLPSSEDDMKHIMQVIIDEGEHSNNHLTQLKVLAEKLAQNKAPFKQLKKIYDFEVVYGAIGHSYSNQNIREMILRRLHELEVTPLQSMQRITLELEDSLLIKPFNLKTENKVINLIKEAKSNDVYEFSKAKILQLEAFHFIAQNKLSEAEKNLNLAIEECKKYSFGKLRGDLARDAFSLAIANQKLIPNNHEKYFRDMIYWGSFEKSNNDLSKINIYNVSRDLHEYFWTGLYKCYPAYEPLFSSSRRDFEVFGGDLLLHIKDSKPISQVLKKHMALRNKQLKYPQADSVITLMMKMGYDMLAKLSNYGLAMPADIENEIKSALSGIINAVREVAQEWPEIVNISDFKQQTPLMLAAHQKDYETVEVLLKAKADPNLKDFTGRTALHSAAASRCLESAQLLLEYGCDEKITMQEGATALHTATRMGELPIVKLLVEKSPELLLVKDSKGITPEQLARSIAEDIDLYEYLKVYLVSENRTVVSHKAYKELDGYFQGQSLSS
jgi:hypothetical protein